jgi:transposase-like protein
LKEKLELKAKIIGDPNNLVWAYLGTGLDPGRRTNQSFGCERRRREHTTPGATPRYPPEFKREAVRLVQSSPHRSVAQIAGELGVSGNSLRRWVISSLRLTREHGKDSQPRSGKSCVDSAKR